jgi:hypothetical protein
MYVPVCLSGLKTVFAGQYNHIMSAIPQSLHNLVADQFVCTQVQRRI